MELLRILATNDSPAILFDPAQERFEVIGNSMPENARGFYDPVIEWLLKYAESPNASTKIVFQMNLLNTSSTKIFVDIFQIINIISEKSDVLISWLYNYGDDDIQEIGVDFKEYTKATFEIVPIKD